MRFGRPMSREGLVFQFVGYGLLIVVVILCVAPLLLVVSGSLSSEESIYQHGFWFIPREFSFDAYRILFKAPKDVLQALWISVLVAATGTITSVFVACMVAYVLIQPEFAYKRFFSIFIYFTAIFSGGLIPTYILMVRYLHLKNTLLALILPQWITAWNLFLLRNFFTEIPYSVVESARIDGAKEFTIMTRLVIPMAMPGITTIALFQILYYWNDWVQAMLYITDKALYPFQYYLYTMLHNFLSVQNAIANAGIVLPSVPTESFKMAMTVIAILPIAIIFPFIKRFFVTGLSKGAIKG
ncbi:ABC-type transporter, integral membrane subunit [Spirochaeta thermophila DSM 6578]|uniref:ABC-type transporter, integral membrane subunit n=1 Tax=Winmispira thermophila (strain ATCC 700085 / DSM 6578 / Z-1203) TaxID=869211 RepID=G0GE07_WINT7|nr:carbohydrate ABC transporter permease [Spirochaeta thermophila]AEJ60639.1 ABC-type transporter, integral membrane subunit [Spirochaeta thermophila DSM 6578]